MPAVARSGGTDSVFSPDGTAYRCGSPMTVATGAPTQSRVFSQGVLVIVANDLPSPHPISGCAPDTQSLSSYSSRVFANGKNIGRIGDTYGNNSVISGSPRVFSN
jgi:uncharacterized Zn-binding protein involved in type VI secretion